MWFLPVEKEAKPTREEIRAWEAEQQAIRRRAGINHFANMRKLARSAFPGISEQRCRYILNKIGNELRRNPRDIYEMEISSTPFGYDPGYFSEFNFVSSGCTVYVRIRVD